MFRSTLLARSFRPAPASLAGRTLAARSYASKKPSEATTQSTDSSVKTPSRPQSETVRRAPAPIFLRSMHCTTKDELARG